MNYIEIKKEFGLNPEDHGNGEDFYTEGKPDECILSAISENVLWVFTAPSGKNFAVRDTDTASEFLGDDELNEYWYGEKGPGYETHEEHLSR
jgi:hypothetical protein